VITGSRSFALDAFQTIAEFAFEAARVVGFQIAFDKSRPDGAPQKLLSKINELGWSPMIHLRDRLTTAFADFLADGCRAIE
jgi:hypothetical protein